MRGPTNWLVLCSSAALLLTATKLPGGPGSGEMQGEPPLAAGENLLDFTYLPREHSDRMVISALLTIRESTIHSPEAAPLLQFGFLAAGDPDPAR
jgi:hypothetical protein